MKMTKNATYLFEGVTRHTRNSESWWSTFFSQVLIYLAQHPSGADDPPIYTYTRSDGYRTVGRLDTTGLNFRNVFVEPHLSAHTFDLQTWPLDLYRLRPDVLILQDSDPRGYLCRGEDYRCFNQQDVGTYTRICTHLGANQWTARLIHLLSHGHEMDSDRTMVQERCLPVVLWADVLAAAQHTPLAVFFAST